jgi:hypothetical protein
MYSHLHQGEDALEIPEKPVRRDSTLVPPSASTGPLKNMDSLPPARKAHALEIHQRAGSSSNTCELPWPVRDDMKKRLSTKRCGGEPPSCAALNYEENGRLAPARAVQAEQPWNSIRRGGLPARLGAHWEVELYASVR